MLPLILDVAFLLSQRCGLFNGSLKPACPSNEAASSSFWVELGLEQPDHVLWALRVL